MADLRSVAAPACREARVRFHFHRSGHATSPRSEPPISAGSRERRTRKWGPKVSQSDISIIIGRASGRAGERATAALNAWLFFLEWTQERFFQPSAGLFGAVVSLSPSGRRQRQHGRSFARRPTGRRRAIELNAHKIRI